MKRKVLCVLVTGLIVASLAGCGTKTEATDQGAESSNVVETDVNIEDTNEDEILDTEVIGEDIDEATEAKINDDGIPTIDCGYLVIYDKVFKPEIEVDWDSFHVLSTPEEYKFNKETYVYGTNGELVGYIKAGSEVTFNNRNDDWFRFNPDVEGVTYPYLMVQVKDLEENTGEDIEEVYKLSPEKVKEMIMEDIEARESGESDEVLTFLDAPTSDMESIEFTIWNQRNELTTREDIMKSLHEVELNIGDFSVGSYLTFYVECTGDEEKVDCVVYYKDMVEIEEQ